MGEAESVPVYRLAVCVCAGLGLIPFEDLAIHKAYVISNQVCAQMTTNFSRAARIDQGIDWT
jgi:hypothetical protein